MIIQADARAIPLADESVQCCVTSPPYWGLRDYGVEDQIGLETAPEEFIENMVSVFREVRRVLRPEGTLWLNLGDSYAGSWGSQSQDGSIFDRNSIARHQVRSALKRKSHAGSIPKDSHLKPKDMVGIPWRVALALQADGWWLRQDIIWHKPNPMPESVTDRCTKSHEYIFLMSKSARYYYDAEAIAEPMTAPEASTPDDLQRANNRRRADQPGRDQKRIPTGWDTGPGNHRKKVGRYTSGNKQRKDGAQRGCPEGSNSNVAGSIPWEGDTRNKRDVWTMTSRPYKGAHFATFPPELPRLCIRAGTKKGDVVLDPFSGSGTTCQVAAELQRTGIGLDISMEYCSGLASKRRAQVDMFA